MSYIKAIGFNSMENLLALHSPALSAEHHFFKKATNT